MNQPTTVLVTGSNGFIGRHLVRHLADSGYKVLAASRNQLGFEHPNVVSVRLDDLSGSLDWRPLLARCEAIVHLAGIAHTNSSPDLYDRINRQATESLAVAAAQLGVPLIFMSSIAAQSGSFAHHELSETDPARPDTAYGRSKLAAEQSVRSAGNDFTILRPVVVYGDGAKGNFATLNKLANLPVPLPLGALTAPRSVLSVDNLSSAVELVLIDRRARGETFIVSDPTPLTVPEIIKRLRLGMGRSSWLVQVPQRWLEFSLRAVGRGAIWQGIGCPLVARPDKLLALGWKPTR
jgi:UDP-glucose 4-epimerase